MDVECGISDDVDEDAESDPVATFVVNDDADDGDLRVVRGERRTRGGSLGRRLDDIT